MLSILSKAESRRASVAAAVTIAFHGGRRDMLEAVRIAFFHGPDGELIEQFQNELT